MTSGLPDQSRACPEGQVKEQRPGRWPTWQRCLWLVLVLWVCFQEGVLFVRGSDLSFIRSLRPERNNLLDFFQEWSSARNLRQGLPVYAPLETSVERHLGYQRPTDAPFFIEYSSRPPTLVVLDLPLAFLDYPDALLVWNLVSLGAFGLSLWLVVRHVELPFSPWWLLPLVVLLTVCNPFRQQVYQGQLNLVLLLLITGAWVAGRSGHPWWAGGLLALATAIKLFPAFLFLYFLVRRQWLVLVAGAVVLLLLNVATLAVVGVRTYHDYVHIALPWLAEQRGSWINASLVGIWTKLFDPQPVAERVVALWRDPTLARFGALASCAAVTAAVAWGTWRARTPAECDRAFALAVTAMLLVSPTTWDHYSLLLLLPLALLWAQLRPGENPAFWVAFTALMLLGPILAVSLHMPLLVAPLLLPLELLARIPRALALGQWALRMILVALWPSQFVYWYVFMGVTYANRFGVVATPWDVLTVLSIPLYALLGLLLLQLALQRTDIRAAASSA
jgi:hypothetical protein